MASFVIRAGTVDEVQADSDEWFIVDLGFSARRRSCGLYQVGSPPEACTFGEVRSRVIRTIGVPGRPLNLLLEAPLSLAFNSEGNPTLRTTDKRIHNGKTQTRPGYVNAGATTLIAAMHLLRAEGTQIKREVKLFEGFASFTWAGAPHVEVVEALWRAVQNPNAHIVGPAELVAARGDYLLPAFTIDGSDFGIPPVIMA